LARAYDIPLPAIALAFALAPEVVDSCAVGVKSPDEVAQSVAWLADAARVPRQLWLDAFSQGLLAWIPS
jgi:D-threo-aldose 1-dehydrogenase